MSMYELFMDRLEAGIWDATKLAVKMIKSAGFWANTDGTYGKPAGFTAFDFSTHAATDAAALQTALSSHTTFDLTAEAITELTVVGVSGYEYQSILNT